MTDEAEQRYLASHDAHDVGALLARWDSLMGEGLFQKVTLSEDSEYPVVGYRSPSSKEGGNGGYYFCAGVHGDEPAGPWGLLAWAEEHIEWLREQSVFLLPCFNPWGLAHNIRTDAEGRDLNRLFHDRTVPVIEAWYRLMKGAQFELALHLHEDYDARGCYVYELTAPELQLAEIGLTASDSILPRETREDVDGNVFERGIFRRNEDLEQAVEEELDGGYPEAIYVFLYHARVALTFETPSEYSLYRRVQAQRIFLDAVVKATEG